MIRHPLLTFIVPVYNVEQYVMQCIMSLVNQTAINHKIIIVNDGSTDSSGEICKNLSNKYPDLITYIEKENGGLGSARNAGIKKVETPYLTFLDSDDWANSHFVEKFQNLIDEAGTDLDLIFEEPQVFDSVTKNIYPFKDNYLLDRIFPNGKITNAKETPDMLSFEVAAWRKVFRTELLRQLNFSFSKGKWEDIRPHFQILHVAKKCTSLRDVGFFYRVNTGGQITASTGRGRLDIISVFNETIALATSEKFSNEEFSYVLRLIMIFSVWFIDVTNEEYVLPLLKGLHEIFNLIPKEKWNKYISTVSETKGTDKFYIFLIRSPFYKMLLNKEKTQKLLNRLKNIKRWLKK